jgi:hypothetical protein
MNIEKHKATRIMKEIVSYFLDNGLNDFNLDFKASNQVVEMTVQAPCQTEPASFQELLKDLQSPREIEVDEYFNALLGSHCSGHDYSFLGKAIDEAQGGFQDGVLTLTIRRYKIK